MLDKLQRNQPSTLGERARAKAAADALRTISQTRREPLLQALRTRGLNGARELLK